MSYLETDFSFLDGLLEEPVAQPKSKSTKPGMAVAGAKVTVTLGAAHRAILSAAHKGKIVSAETREKLGAVHRGKTLSAEHLAKLKAANTGKKHSAEARAKISAANKGIHKGKKLSEEHKAKLRASHKPPQEYVTPLGKFVSFKVACAAHGFGGNPMRDRMKKFPDQFYYITKGD